jgi:tetratricopeptide (TPR) repeat protein
MGWLSHHLATIEAPGLIVRLGGCRTLADAVLQLGWEVGAQSPGSPVSTGAALAGTDDLTIVIDARGSDPDLVLAVQSSLATIAVSARWLIATLEPVPDHVHMLTDDQGQAMPEEISLQAELAALLPNSDRLKFELETAYQAHDAPPGCVDPNLVRRLLRHPQRSIASLSDQMIEHHRDLLSIATGSHLAGIAGPEDLFGLRLISEHASDSNVACLAAAAAARLRNRLGQPAEAFERIEQALSRALLADPAHRALVVWAHARVHLDLGDLQRAAERFKEATHLVHVSRDLALLTTMHRRWADTLAARSELNAAAEHYRTARSLFRRRGDAEGLAATLRGSADVAVAAGEAVSAEALYDQAEMTTTSNIEQANRYLGWAGLAIAQGELTRARTFTEKAQRVAGDHPLVMANCARRKSDIALHSGDPVTAAIEAEVARSAYALKGDHSAAARCIRILGDSAACQGHLQEAATHYHRALSAQIRVGDMAGLHKTISHVIALEDDVGDQNKADVLRRIAVRLSNARVFA